MWQSGEQMAQLRFAGGAPTRMMLLCKADAILGYTEELRRQVASEASDDHVGD